MKKIYLTFLILTAILLSGCDNSTNTHNNKKEAVDKNIPSLSLTEFNKKAKDYIGKKVEVTGIVDHICKHSGKKMLLVSEGADVHIYSDERFDTELSGSKIKVIGVVLEKRIDEQNCNHMEEEIEEHLKKGDIDEKIYNQRKANIDYLRDSMKNIHSNHLSFFSLEYISHKTLAE